MKKKNFIEFKEVQYKHRKTPIVYVTSTASGDKLGQIQWYSPWRAYTFQPYENTIFDENCLVEITGKVVEMNLKIRGEWKAGAAK